MYDIFVHAGDGLRSVRRFGEDIFEKRGRRVRSGSRSISRLHGLRRGPGDGLTINMWGGVSSVLESTVDHQGRIAIPGSRSGVRQRETLGEVQLAVQRELRHDVSCRIRRVSLSRLRTISSLRGRRREQSGRYDVTFSTR